MWFYQANKKGAKPHSPVLKVLSRGLLGRLRGSVILMPPALRMKELVGPVILFIHGFPELWYSWRHQIVALAAQGYQAVAPDMRGYGDTDAPEDLRSYSCLHIVGDLVGIMDAVAPDQEKSAGLPWTVAKGQDTFTPISSVELQKALAL
ncbi:uncharacterized protein [Euphorbia lathyris]|uniref:uncharacterized protein n=1 Tax=Euphorbia lathyris TaxID=212925 RepID=UPI0033134503